MANVSAEEIDLQLLHLEEKLFNNVDVGPGMDAKDRITQFEHQTGERKSVCLLSVSHNC